MTRSRNAWLAGMAALCLATGGLSAQASNKPPCTGHNLTRHGDVVKGMAPIVLIRYQVGMGETGIQRRRWEPFDIGYACPGDLLSIEITAVDLDDHICQKPVVHTNMVENFIRDTSLTLVVTNPQGVQTLVPMQRVQEGERAFIRNWAALLELPEDGAVGEWSFTFAGEPIEDVLCQTFKPTQDHSRSKDEPVDMGSYR